MAPNLRVVWIAPEIPGLPSLSWLTELGEMGQVDGVKLCPVTGPRVTKQDIARALRLRHDVTIWSGHGAPGGLLLPDGVLVRPKWLATQARCGIPRLIVLAACGSQLRDDDLKSIAEEISRQGLNVIGFPLQAEDKAAVAFNVELIRALVTGTNVGNAFDVALESIADSKTATGIFLTPGLTNGYRDVVLRLEALEDGQRALVQSVDLIVEHLGIPKGKKQESSSTFNCEDT